MKTAVTVCFLAVLGLSIALASTLYLSDALGAEEPQVTTLKGDAGAVAASAAPLEMPGSHVPPADDRPAVAAPTADDPFDAAVAAAKQGQWLALIGIILVAVVAFVRRKHGWIASKVAWFRTDRGGAVLLLILGVIAEVATTLASSQSAPPGTVTGLTAVIAAGGRALIRALFAPKDKAAAAQASA